MNAHTPSVPPNRPSLVRTVKAVLSSFVGIRKGSELQEDMGRLNPFHVIGVAIVAVALFVGALVLLVHWVVAK